MNSKLLLLMNVALLVSITVWVVAMVAMLPYVSN